MSGARCVSVYGVCRSFVCVLSDSILESVHLVNVPLRRRPDTDVESITEGRTSNDRYDWIEEETWERHDERGGEREGVPNECASHRSSE